MAEFDSEQIGRASQSVPTRGQRILGLLVCFLGLPTASCLWAMASLLDHNRFNLNRYWPAPEHPLIRPVIVLGQILGDYWIVWFPLLAISYWYWISKRSKRMLWFNAGYILLWIALLWFSTKVCLEQIELLRQYAKVH